MPSTPTEDPRGVEAFDDHDFYDEEHRRHPVRRALGCLLPLALIAGLGYGGWRFYEHTRDNWGSPTCQVRADTFVSEWTPEQAANASTITVVGTLKRGLPDHAATIALTTAIQESKLRNLTYGDRDSLGLFQQRPSMGWGTSAQILDPVYSSDKFYSAMLKVPDWQTDSVGDVAQSVQKSGFPDAYDEHVDQGRTLATALSGQVTEGVGCRLDAVTGTADPAATAAKLTAQSGVRGTVSGSSITVSAKSEQEARAVANWAVTHADSDKVTMVTVGSRQWQRLRGEDGLVWHDAEQPTSGSTVVRIDF
ncbi:hypothetical protein ATK17_0389 [Branchiibius hedensis]|uniref:Uncharacterized protein n=1 Tax=Branchiibius hedensis TaxID=672460 RepID=A0A2Y8ZP74_9MICO|nr:hypothetical protein [Branchiibius hedensis]PWJ24301.1 hypothetical protein ATK17_0389 [Branchiibius hedensis]SSA33118.1 hypothetical protein SAMN04489750_0389 [Branchiibius hedensis]